MDQLQKKCFLASTGFHLSLLVIVLVGSAFLASRGKANNVVSPSKPDGMTVLDYVAPETVNSALTSGGDLQAHAQSVKFDKLPAAPSPSVTSPVLPQQRTPARDRMKEVSAPKHPGESLEPTTDRLPKELTFKFTPITRPPRKARTGATTPAEASGQQPEYDRQVAAWQHSASAALAGALQSLESGRSGSTTFERPASTGGSIPYSDFYQRVKSVYSHAWIVPDGITDESATVGASVTIAGDGRVVSARITRFSRNLGVDQSVQATLDRVKYAAALADGTAENQRTLSINFNVAARRALE
jgi:hypothetical protein